MSITVECPLESIERAIAFSSRDFNEYNRDAWVYGIVMGWDESLDEVCKKHGWTEDTKERLKRLRLSWKNLKQREDSRNESNM